MLKKLPEEDFAALRGPFESGRQSPAKLGGILLLSIPVHVLVFMLIYNTIGYNTSFPYRDQLYHIHLVFMIIISVLSIIYGLSPVYKRGQKMQYFVSILISQFMFGISFFLGSLYLLGSIGTWMMEEATLMTITYILLATGILILIATCIRFYRLLHQGAYRAGSDKDMWRIKFEKKQLFIPAVIAGTSISLILVSLNRRVMYIEFDDVYLLMLGPILFFTMLFVLPEQLMLLYCKFRFQSFNYDRNGNLMLSANEEEKENEIRDS